MVFQQTGKDLTGVEILLMTGGALVFSGEAERIAQQALAGVEDPSSLKPRDARVVLDRQYILAAMGLLCEQYPEAAFDIMCQEFLKQKGA